MRAADAGLGLRILADLLDAKLSVAKAIAAFATLAPQVWRPALPDIQSAIWGGSSLATALAESTLALDPIVVTMIASGELGSDLAAGVARAADLSERSAANRNAIRNALAYPIVLAVTGTASLVFLLVFVLPRFAVIIADVGGTLPRSTQTVLWAAAAGRAALLPSVAIAAIVLALWRAIIGQYAGRIRWHRALLALPLVGTVRRSGATARAATVLGTLIQSGVPLPTAMSHAAAASGDAAFEAAIMDSREAVTRGERLSDAIMRAKTMTPTATLLIRAGEETGRLSEMLLRVASIEQERAERQVRSSVRLLEPTLILAFGAIVAFVATALLQAVYSVRPGG